MSVEDLVHMLFGINIDFPDVRVCYTLIATSNIYDYHEQSDEQSWSAKQLLSAKNFLRQFDTGGGELTRFPPIACS